LDSIKNAKMKDEKKIEQLQRGWKMEREQSELVKMAMVNQHKQELEAVRAGGRQKMAAMQTELVTTMEMLEKMYNGWQNSLEDALTEMRITSEAERKKAVEGARREVEGHLLDSERRLTHLQEQYQIEHTRRKQSHNKLIELMGNIRVICRVRPINKTEISSGQGQDCTAYPTEAADENIIIKSPVSNGKGGMLVDADDPGEKAGDGGCSLEWQLLSRHIPCAVNVLNLLLRVRVLLRAGLGCVFCRDQVRVRRRVRADLDAGAGVQRAQAARHQLHGRLQRDHLRVRPDGKRQDVHHGRWGPAGRALLPRL